MLRIRVRLYLPPRPAWTMRRGASTSTKVTSAQSKRFSGAVKRKRPPAPRPWVSTRVMRQSTR